MDKLIEKLKEIGITAEMLREVETIEDIVRELEPKVCKNQLFWVDGKRPRYATGAPDNEKGREFYMNGRTSETVAGFFRSKHFRPVLKQRSIIAWQKNTGVAPELSEKEKHRFICELAGRNEIYKWADMGVWSLDSDYSVTRWALCDVF